MCKSRYSVLYVFGVFKSDSPISRQKHGGVSDDRDNRNQHSRQNSKYVNDA